MAAMVAVVTGALAAAAAVASAPLAVVMGSGIALASLRHNCRLERRTGSARTVPNTPA